MLLLGVSSVMFGQSVPRGFLYNKPMSFFISNFEIGMDKTLDRTTTIGASFGYGATEDDDFNQGESNEFRLELNMKFFMDKMNAENTYYVEPFVLFKYKNLKEETFDPWGPGQTLEYNASALNLGFLAAKRFHKGKRFFVDIMVGGGMVFPIGTDKIDRTEISLSAVNPYTRGVFPRLGMNLGIILK
jgi:hypothetical protein